MVVRISYETCVWDKGWEQRKEYSCFDLERSEEGCVGACPTGALYREDKLKVNEDDCIDCNACIDACFLEALVLE